MKWKTKALMAGGGVAAALTVREMIARANEAVIAGEVVLITGGSRGLGLALAREFAKEGCRLALLARDEAELGRARSTLEKTGANVHTVVCDVSNRGQIEQAIRAVRDHFGRIDILVNNAGIIQVGPAAAMTVEDFQKAMDVMFWGVVYPTLAVLPDFLARKSGRIVNITSIGGKVSVPHLLPYTSAKFAASGFSEGLRAELSQEGIAVTTIAPGLMRTGSFVNALFTGDRESESRWFSLGASLPGISMSATRAARQIVTATKRGQSEKVLSSPAQLLARFHGLFPGTSADLLGVAAGLILPSDRSRTHPLRGEHIKGLRTPAMKLLLALGRSATRRFNQSPI